MANGIHRDSVENNFGDFVNAQLNFMVASTDNRIDIAIYRWYSFSASFRKANTQTHTRTANYPAHVCKGFTVNGRYEQLFRTITI